MRQLGDLEAVVMAHLWDGGRTASVREVMDDLGRNRKIAYTTVMTVMDNLYRKGLLTRQLDGRAYRYTPLQDRAEHSAELIAAVLADTEDRAAPILRFMERMTPQEVARLRAALDDRDAAGRRRSRPAADKKTRDMPK